MTDRVLVDTGPLVAFCSSKDQHHRRCVSQLTKLHPPLLTCWPVLGEAAYLLRNDRIAFSLLLQSFDAGLIELLTLEQTEISDLAKVISKYRNLEPQLADAALVYLAGREDIRTIFTIDRRDFSVYRTTSNKSFLVVP